MKKRKTLNRLLAMLLTFILCAGELSSTGIKVFAADAAETAVSENDTVSEDSIRKDDTVSEDESKAPVENAGMNESEDDEDDIEAEEEELLAGNTVFLYDLTDDYIAQDGDVLRGRLAGNHKISIADGATVTFNGITIEGVDDNAFQWAGVTCEGDATIILKGSNVVRGFMYREPGIFVKKGKTLTITGDGILEASSNGQGCGIGSAFTREDSGNVIIKSGTVFAYGGSGCAAIGAASCTSCGYITIDGGTVYAYGGTYAAGIGSGNSVVSKTDTGTTVKASECGNITINRGTVYAFGGLRGAGIGSGYGDKEYECSRCGEISIGDAIEYIYAKRGSKEALCIGEGWYGTVEKISIDEALKDSTFENIRIISKADAVVATAKNVEVRYDGKAHGIEVVVSQPENEAKVMYGTVYGEYDLETSPTFTDTGKYKVYYEVTADGYIACRGEAAVEILKGYQTAPSAPTVNSVTSDSVTLNPIENGEYKYLIYKDVWGWDDGCEWQDSPVFTGLHKNTTYRFVQSFKALPNYYRSAYSDYIEVTTGVQGYNVVFNLNGHGKQVPSSLYVEKGKTAAKPADPVDEDGWIFEDWYTEAECIHKYDFDTPVTKDINLYAKWVDDSVVTYTVTFNANGVAASGMPAAQTIEEGKPATKPASDPSAEGYKFEDWYKEAAGTNEFDFTKAITEDTVIYAKWSKIVVPGPGPSHSPLDPKPEIKDDTTRLYLVKGQKFTLGVDWSLDDSDKDKLKAYKKLFSISKKGKVTVKKPGEVVIVKKDAGGNVLQSIAVNITKPELTEKKLKLEAGVVDKDTGSVELKNAENINVYYYSSAPDVATVDQTGKVTAVAKGSAKVTAYANGTAYTASVSVKEPSAVKERTLHLPVKGSKSVKLSGVKKTVWEYAEGTAEEEKAVVSIKNAKITALKAGTITLIAKDEMTSYKMTVKVDDPSITPVHEEDKYDLKSAGKNKYALTMAAGQKLTLSYTDIDQPVIYKSSKPETAFIDEKGNIEARGKGKGKFTAKVNGKTITISVTVK